MSQINAAITAVVGYVPDDVLSNKDLEKLVDTTDEWITTRTGIRERRILKGGLATSDMGAKVVAALLEKSGTKPEDLELLICATVTGDMVFPDTANTILDKVGAKSGFGFDVNAACSGFLYSLEVGSNFIKSGRYKKVIVLGADMMSSIVDYTDRTTSIIFGDGAGAVLLEPNYENLGVMDAILKSDGAGREFLHMKAGGSLRPASHDTVENKEHYVYQVGKVVFKSAVTGMVNTTNDLLLRNGLNIDDVRWLVPHQANIRIIQSVGDMLGIETEKVMMNIQKYGNTTAATIPLCLWEYENQIQKNDNLVLTAFGGGFTWGSTLIKWAY